MNSSKIPKVVFFGENENNRVVTVATAGMNLKEMSFAWLKQNPVEKSRKSFFQILTLIQFFFNWGLIF